MAQIAVTILDPSNSRSAHLVETRLLVRELIPPLVAELKLPERPTYQLFRLGSEDALPADKTLAENGIPAGAELQLKPVRNQILKAILDKLYEEAQGYVEEQAWELAKEKLEAIFRLDPTFPDPLELVKATVIHAGALRSVPRAEGVTARSNPFAASRAPVTPTVLPSVPPILPSGSGGAYQLSAAGAKGGMSCVVISLIFAGVLIAGSIALVGTVMFLPGIVSDLADQVGIQIPDGETLGTGDVQVTLRWQGEADLDLHVIDPNGEEISYETPQSTSGGILDVDANGECQGEARPVENIYWPTGEAPDGTYEVRVVYYQSCGFTEPVDYEVTITVDGEVMDVINAQMSSEGEEHPVTIFYY